MKILKRTPAKEESESEEIKKEINKLRIVRKVIRTGHLAMDILTEGLKVIVDYFSKIKHFIKKSELVLFTDNIPTKSLLLQILKVCIFI